MNLNNWRNWGTNLMIRFGFRDQYAHAFVEQDYFIEDTTEEVSLAPTFLEFRIGRNWYNPFKWGVDDRPRGQPDPVDLEKIKREAVAEAAKAAEAARAKDKLASDKMAAEIKAMKDAEAKRLKQRQATLTSSASSLSIGGARGTSDTKRKKADRKMTTDRTSKRLDPTLLNPVAGAPGEGGSGGVPVL